MSRIIPNPRFSAEDQKHLESTRRKMNWKIRGGLIGGLIIMATSCAAILADGEGEIFPSYLVVPVIIVGVVLCVYGASAHLASSGEWIRLLGNKTLDLDYEFDLWEVPENISTESVLRALDARDEYDKYVDEHPLLEKDTAGLSDDDKEWQKALIAERDSLSAAVGEALRGKSLSGAGS